MRGSSIANKRVPWVLAGMASAVAVTIARLWVSRDRLTYAIWPDEPAQLAIARFIGGGVRWTMHDHSTWQPGYGIVLSPLYLFTDDPTTIFRGAMVLNAMLGGAAAVCLMLVGRRLTSIRPASCAAAATLLSVAPGVVFHTDFAWSESLVVVLFLATLLTLLRVRDVPSITRGLVAGTLAVAAYATHSRMAPLSVAVAVVVIVEWRRDRISARAGVAVVAWIGCMFIAVTLLSRLVVGALWDEPLDRNSFGGVASQLTHIGAMLASLAGQSWYLLVSSLGIAGLGLLVVIRAARAHGDERPTAGDASLVLAVVGAEFALSVVFMADRWRPDQIVYGRYNDAVFGPLLMVGFAHLLRPATMRRIAGDAIVIAGAVAATAGALMLFRREELGSGVGVEVMILGLGGFLGDASSIEVVRITVLASSLALVVWAAAVTTRATRARAFAPLVLAAVVLVAAVRTYDLIERRATGDGRLRPVEALATTLLADGQSVDFVLPPDSDDTGRLMRYQFSLPRNELTIVNDAPSGSTASFVFAPLSHRALAEAGASVVWRDPDAPIGLWERERPGGREPAAPHRNGGA